MPVLVGIEAQIDTRILPDRGIGALIFFWSA